MRLNKRFTVYLALAVSASVLTACGASSQGGGKVNGDTLTVYSSLSLSGSSSRAAEDIVKGEKLALAEAGGKAGEFTVNYVSLNDVDPKKPGKWDPGQVSANARRAAEDATTIAYLGELESGATAISLPIINEAGILQVSPGSTAVGLTRSGGAAKGEPDKYYPSGERNFARVIPGDHLQVAALLKYMQAEGVKEIYPIHDKQPYGKGLADQLSQTAASSKGVVAASKEGDERVLGPEGIDPESIDPKALADRVATSKADAVFYSSADVEASLPILNAIHLAAPKKKIFLPVDFSYTALSDRRFLILGSQLFTVSPEVPIGKYPPAGKAFVKRFEAKYGAEPGPYAIYGYEAMGATLQAVEDAGKKGNERQAVIDAFHAIKDRSSPLGTYSIDRQGDTTLGLYAGYHFQRRQKGLPVPDRLITVAK